MYMYMYMYDVYTMYMYMYMYMYDVSPVSPFPPPFYMKPLYSSESSQYLPSFLYIGSCINHPPLSSI